MLICKEAKICNCTIDVLLLLQKLDCSENAALDVYGFGVSS